MNQFDEGAGHISKPYEETSSGEKFEVVEAEAERGGLRRALEFALGVAACVGLVLAYALLLCLILMIAFWAG